MRAAKFHSINLMQNSTWSLDLQPGDVARVVQAVFTVQNQSSWGAWNILVVVGPPETVDEMAAAMARTLRSAP